MPDKVELMQEETMTSAVAPPEAPRPRRGLSSARWIAQGLVGAAFLMAGGMKLIMSADDLAKQGATVSMGLVRFIGVAEVAGALGVILPSATRILPRLTALAAVGL